MNTRIFTLAVGLVLCAGCADDLTQLVIVLSSDMPQSDLEKVDVTIIGPSGDMVLGSTNDFTEPGASDLPLTIGLVLEGDTDAPVQIRTRLTRLDGGEIQHDVVTGFVPNQTRAVEIRYAEACVPLVCGDDRCVVDPAEGAQCVTSAVPAESLPQFTGDPADHL